MGSCSTTIPPAITFMTQIGSAFLHLQILQKYDEFAQQKKMLPEFIFILLLLFSLLVLFLKYIFSKKKYNAYCIITTPIILCPFPNISCHVIKTEFVWWKTIDRGCRNVSIFCGVFVGECTLPYVGPKKRYKLK